MIARTAAGARRAWRLVVRVARTAKTLMLSKRLPWWLRGMFAVLFFGCQFLIGPADDVLLLIPVGLTYLMYRDVLAEAWAGSHRPPAEAPA